MRVWAIVVRIIRQFFRDKRTLAGDTAKTLGNRGWLHYWVWFIYDAAGGLDCMVCC
jgi:hypothetical protein